MNLVVSQINNTLIKEEFYNKIMQDWLDDNDVLIYTTHNEGNSVIPETFIEILKTDYYLILIILLWLKKAETNAKVRS